jgi:hypothetical protein
MMIHCDASRRFMILLLDGDLRRGSASIPGCGISGSVTTGAE